MHGVGCTATVVKLLQRHPDGRMDVIVQGDRRYRVTDVHTSVAPYVVADVEEIEDDDVPIDVMPLRECADLFSTLLGLVYPDRDQMAIEAYFDSPHHVSYIMALKAGLDVQQKQHILELTDENERILYLRDHMKTLIPSIERDQLVQRVIANDGYIIPGRSK
jgi:Lon protease-like protein